MKARNKNRLSGKSETVPEGKPSPKTRSGSLVVVAVAEVEIVAAAFDVDVVMMACDPVEVDAVPPVSKLEGFEDDDTEVAVQVEQPGLVSGYIVVVVKPVMQTSVRISAMATKLLSLIGPMTVLNVKPSQYWIGCS